MTENPTRLPDWADEWGLRPNLAFLCDVRFYVALAVAPVVLSLSGFVHPGLSRGLQFGWSLLFWSVVWQPLVEEVLFRGVIQGRLSRGSWGQSSVFGMSTANLATSVLFAVAHLVHYPLLAAAAVFFPSLVFGYFRQRHGSLYASLALHAAYNAIYISTVSRT